MNNEPVAYVNSMCNDYIDWKIDPMSIDGQSLYTHPAKTLTDAEIESLKEINAKQVDYIAEQKLAYETLWKEHMELFWKHEQDKDLTNE